MYRLPGVVVCVELVIATHIVMNGLILAILEAKRIKWVKCVKFSFNKSQIINLTSSYLGAYWVIVPSKHN